MKSIYLLTTSNENYLPRLQVMSTFLAIHNPKDAIICTLRGRSGEAAYEAEL